MRSHEFITEKWSQKYKRNINCNNPKGFSQRAHCQGRKKKTNESIIDEAKANKLFQFITNSLKKAGYKKLGTGMDATVWMKDQGTVVKIIMPDYDPEKSIGRMSTFYKFAKQHPELENLPKFKKADGRELYKFSLGGVPFMQVSMEQLSPLKKDSFEEWVVWWLSGEVDKNWKIAYDSLTNTRMAQHKEFRKQFKNLPPDQVEKYRKFYETFRMLYRLGKKNKFGWDAHTENVMQRNDGTLVITDPWA